MRARALQMLPALFVVALLIGAWELYVDLAGVDAAVLPAPHDVAAALPVSAQQTHTLKATPKTVAWGYYSAAATPNLRIFLF